MTTDPNVALAALNDETRQQIAARLQGQRAVPEESAPPVEKWRYSQVVPVDQQPESMGPEAVANLRKLRALPEAELLAYLQERTKHLACVGVALSGFSGPPTSDQT